MSGLEPSEITDTVQLADLGIDSLMGMEVARELGGLFGVSLKIDDLFDITDFRSLTHHMHSVLGVMSNGTNNVAQPDGLAASSEDAHQVVNGSANSSKPPSLHSSEHYSNGVSGPGDTGVNGVSSKAELTLKMFERDFAECKKLTDKTLAEFGCGGYAAIVMPEMDKLCVALAIDALDDLGCPLNTAKPGDIFSRVEVIPKQKSLADFLYRMLSQTGLVSENKAASSITCSKSIAHPRESARTILQRLIQEYPEQNCASQLTHFTGTKLAEVLRGHCDGIQLIFGSKEGKELVAALYGDFLLNQVANAQMRDLVTRLAANPGLFSSSEPLRILEMGGGTGGTTVQMVEMLARLDIPCIYTFTDLSGSFVVAARKRFKQYASIMAFRTHDIEKTPPSDLLGTQHVIIASNAIHATHNLIQSSANVRKALRPEGGVLMMMEMTQPLHWVDMIFGLFEGWWLFNDGREHAVASVSVWKQSLKEAGFSHVVRTDGESPETQLERVIVTYTSSMVPRYDDPHPQPNRISPSLVPDKTVVDTAVTRRAAVDKFVEKYSKGFECPLPSLSSTNGYHARPSGACVAITGGTGSLGAHIVAYLTNQQEVSQVICLNRRSETADPDTRQQQAFSQRGIAVTATARDKIQVLEVDTAASHLGLSDVQYSALVVSVTHIIHNAWPMSSKRPLAGLETQFRVMRNLIDLVNGAASTHRKGSHKVTFQLVSSIATVGNYPFHHAGTVVVPEQRMVLESVLPNGYGDAKFICERMLDETLHRYPDAFRPMVVRPGQISGSSISGFWNPQEHLSFLIKSSQTLSCLPDLRGPCCWTPVDDVATTLGQLLLSGQATSPVYHIDNPVRQPWEEMIPLLQRQLSVTRIVPFDEWISLVRSYKGPASDNPAVRLVDFLEDNFQRMSCGGLLLDTRRACEHSPHLATVGPVSAETVAKYILAWRQMGFL